MMRRVLAGVIGVVLAATLLGPAQSAARPMWDTEVMAHVQSPGFPAYVFVHRNGRVYAATYTNLAGDSMRSRIFEWTADGTLLRSWTMPGQDLSVDHGVQVATQDAAGRLILLEKSTHSVWTLNTVTGKFRKRATLRDLPTCSSAPAPCTPNLVDAGPIPNYAAWGPDGSLYISDYGQAVIWKIPAGTRKVVPWFTDAGLDGTEFGTTGLVWDNPHRRFVIAQQTTTAQVVSGALYSLGMKRGRPGTLRTLWTSGPAELPDGFGIAASGAIYLSLAGLTNQLVKLASDGSEIEKFPSTPFTGDNGSPVAFDTPSSATFLGTSILVANQAAIGGDSTKHAILNVEVGEPGRRVFIPRGAQLR